MKTLSESILNTDISVSDRKVRDSLYGIKEWKDLIKDNLPKIPAGFRDAAADMDIDVVDGIVLLDSIGHNYIYLDNNICNPPDEILRFNRVSADKEMIISGNVGGIREFFDSCIFNKGVHISHASEILVNHIYTPSIFLDMSTFIPRMKFQSTCDVIHATTQQPGALDFSKCELRNCKFLHIYSLRNKDFKTFLQEMISTSDTPDTLHRLCEGKEVGGPGDKIMIHQGFILSFPQNVAKLTPKNYSSKFAIILQPSGADQGLCISRSKPNPKYLMGEATEAPGGWYVWFVKNIKKFTK